MDWHRLLWISLTDYFEGTSYQVKSEVELAQKRQRLDILVISEEGNIKPKEICDGFEDLY